MYIANPFEDHLSSAFVITSPYQAICCVEAINQFNIIEYEVFVMIYEGLNMRLNQIKDILTHYVIHFKVIYCNKYSYLKYLITPLYLTPSFKRVFIGDFYSTLFVFWGICRIKKYGCLIYMDDGNSTISIFNDKLEHYRMRGVLYQVFCYYSKFLCRIKNIEFRRHFYTTYVDIFNKKYNLYPNKLSHLCNKSMQIIKKQCVFLGTSPTSFCKVNTITIDQYHSALYACLKDLSRRFELTYIPHGQDKDNDVFSFCNKENIKYLRISGCIENYLLSSNTIMGHAFGFTSSALYTIKKMFPSVRVVNVRLTTSKPNAEYDDITSYYERNEIETIYIKC